MAVAFKFNNIALSLLLILTFATQSSSALIYDISRNCVFDEKSKQLFSKIPFGKITVTTDDFQDIASAVVLGHNDEPALGSRAVLTCAHVFEGVEKGSLVEFYSPHQDKIIQIHNWIIHPDYKDHPHSADLAIAELESSILYKKPIILSQSLTSNTKYNLSSFAYGLTSTYGSSSASTKAKKMGHELISYPGEMVHFFEQTFHFDDKDQVLSDPFQFDKVLHLSSRKGFGFEYIPLDIPGQDSHCVPGMGDSGSFWFSIDDDIVKGVAVTSGLHVDFKIQAKIQSYVWGKGSEFTKFRENPFFSSFAFIDLPEIYPAQTNLTPLHLHTKWIKDCVEMIEESQPALQ